MFHHDSRDYAEAASAAAAVARQKMEDVIHRGQASAEAVVATIQGARLRDRVVPATALRLRTDSNGFRLSSGYTSDADNRLHPHAFGQVMQASGLGTQFVTNIRREAKNEGWGDELIAHNVNEIMARRTTERHLIRMDEDDERVKGFLSDRYRRLDSRPLLDKFMGLCTDVGLVPIEGVASDTKCRVRAVLPKVFEPLDHECMIFGLEFGNSDYGDGGMVLNLWTMRMMCTNLAVTQKGLRQVHLGGKLPDDIRFSDELYRKDAEVVALAVAEMGHQLIGPGPVNAMLEAVKGATEKEVRSGDIDKYLRGLDKGEVNAVRGLYEGPDEQNLPAGATVYRLSNAVSFFAQAKSIGADRKMELQEVAGRLLVPDQKAVTVKDV